MSILYLKVIRPLKAFLVESLICPSKNTSRWTLNAFYWGPLHLHRDERATLRKEFGKGNISDNCQFALKPRLARTWHPVDNNHWLHPNIEKGQEQRGAHEGQSKSIFIIWVYFDFLKLSYELKNWIKWKLFLAKSKEVLGSSWTRRYSCRSSKSNL